MKLNTKNKNKNKKSKTYRNEFLNNEQSLSILTDWDETEISYKYGQENFENSLIVISIGIVYTTFLVYWYLKYLETLNILLFMITAIIDIILLTILLYFFYKFKKEEVFTRVPSSCFNITDILNFLNIVVKAVNFFCLLVCSDSLDWLFVSLLSIKFLIDLYFCMNALKIYIFCGCGIVLSRFFTNAWNNFKYYILCIDPEVNSDISYQRMTDEESFY
jgi:hypothetical protein